MKLFRAVSKQFLFHLFALIISLILVGPLWFIFDKAQTFYSIITALIYCGMMYSVGWNYGYLDGRKIPGYYPDPKFPFIAAALGLIVPICLLVLKVAFPNIWQIDLPFLKGETDFLFVGNRLDGMTDFIFKMWYFPFGAFISGKGIATCILVMLMQPVMVIAGYFVGLKRFSIIEAVTAKLMYQKKKK